MKNAQQLYRSFIEATNDRSELAGPEIVRRVSAVVGSIHKESLTSSVLGSQGDLSLMNTVLCQAAYRAVVSLRSPRRYAQTFCSDVTMDLLCAKYEEARDRKLYPSESFIFSAAIAAASQLIFEQKIDAGYVVSRGLNAAVENIAQRCIKLIAPLVFGSGAQ